MVKDAGADKSITVEMDAFDRDKYQFNCHNGTINLLDMSFHPHDPADRLTKMTEVDYDPEAACPRWLSFMDEVFEGDQDRIRYLQKAVGYGMSGDTRLECMFILYGPTSRNGKGTTMETVLRILGEYGRTAKPEMLSKKGYADSSGPSEDVARLNGARMVNVSEPEKSMVIDASLTKQMTGNNILTARYLRENSFEFKPQFKLFIDTNHLPQISDMTLFESDRIRIIPFNRHFTADERDIDLKSFFAEPTNLSGILNWCLEGFRLYQKEGLKMPDSVERATKEYRNQSDRITMFTNHWLRKQAGQELRSSAIYTRYREWCGENGFKYENAANFKKKMASAGFVYMLRRPWNEKNTGATVMVNDVAWVTPEDAPGLPL
jgi:putative DNA primase/helicase